jgi:hypothetical protein
MICISIIYFKIAVAVGLAMTLAGLIMMIKAKQMKIDGKSAEIIGGPIDQKLWIGGWFFTIIGYVLQIIGIFYI